MSTPSSLLTADLIILGGGCAGLSLASRLAASDAPLRVLILEARDQYEEDRTWCGWRTAPHPFEHCATAAWSKWRIACERETIERGSTRYPYEMIPADRFYAEALRIMATSATTSIEMTAQVAAATEQTDLVEISLVDGRRFAAPWVIDTRPRVTALRPPSLWQNFVGYVVHGSQVLAARIGETPVLMDFAVSGTGVVQFMYLLPLGGGSYLCEWTRFAKDCGEQALIEQQLLEWIGKNASSGWSLGRRECGSLPMHVGTQADASLRRVVAAGTAGGSMRASTGYAFHAIQRWADTCSTALLAGQPPTPPVRYRVLDFMDDVFLRALQQKNRSGQAIFCSLFRKTEADTLLRFLTGQPRLTDYWPVMRSLPWIDFSKAALQSLSGAGVR